MLAPSTRKSFFNVTNVIMSQTLCLSGFSQWH